MTLGQGQEMTLTFITHICSFFQLVSGSTGCKCFWKINSFHRKAYVTKFNLARKIGQVHPRVHHLYKLWLAGVPDTIYQVFVGIGLPVPEKKIFKGFEHFLSMAAILVMWPGSFYIDFSFSPSQGGYTWNLALIGQAVSKEKKFENVNGRPYDGRRDHGVYYKLTLWAWRLRLG